LNALRRERQTTVGFWHFICLRNDDVLKHQRCGGSRKFWQSPNTQTHNEQQNCGIPEGRSAQSIDKWEENFVVET
jgi:hypothetical protein